MNTHKIILRLFLMLLLFFSYAYSQDSTEEAKQHYEKGRQYYEKEKYKEAKEEFQKALALVTPQESKLTPSPKPFRYIISEQDTLFISVWQNKELDQDIIIRPDGMISFPLVGELQAAGLTVAELTQELKRRLEEYIKSPVVSVTIKKFGGQKVIVLGQVGTPGVYELSGKQTLLEVIALAGSFTADATLSSVIVVKGGLKTPKGLRLNLVRTIEKADMSQNILLQAGDIVYVPNKFIADVNYFMSRVIGPIIQGAITLDETGKRRW